METFPLFKVCFLQELHLDSPLVTLISSKNFFIEIVFFFPITYFSYLTYGHVEESTHFFLKQNFNSETVFFLVLSLVTVFDFALLCELQHRPRKTNLIVFLVLSFQKTWLKCMFLYLSPWPMILLFCFDFFGQNILFYIKENNLGIFLEFL